MADIRGDQRHQSVSFRQKDPRSSMAIMLSDSSPDASWRLRIEVETADGGWFTLGAVDTIPPAVLLVQDPNRLVAVCSIPGALNWKVYPELIVGTPIRNRKVVMGEMKLSSCPEYAAGCCPLVAIPGNSVDVNGPSQTPTGPPPVGARLSLFTGPGFSLLANVVYLGVAVAPPFVQQHDAAPSDPLSDATMVGIGYQFPALRPLMLKWDPGLRFEKGFTLALSSTINTFTAAADTMSAFGQWSLTRQ